MNNDYCYVVNMETKKIFCITKSYTEAVRIIGALFVLGKNVSWDYLHCIKSSCGKQTNKIHKLCDKINKGEI